MGNLVFQATLGGQVNLVGPNTASTFNINVPAIAGTLVTTGDTGTVTNTMCASSVYTSPGTIGSGTANTGAFTTLSASGVATFSAGSAAAPALTTSGDTNTGVLFPAADTIALTTGGTERARVDSSGNLGLGVIPSAWSVVQPAIQLGSAGSYIAGQGSNPWIGIGANSYYDGSNWKYKVSNIAGGYFMNGNTHEWRIAASGTAGNTISFTQAMTLDASGNLGVGTTSPAQKLDVVGSGAAIAIRAATTSGNAAFVETSAQTGTVVARLQSNVDGAWSGTLTNHAYFFQTNGSERARIDSSGNLLVGTTTANGRLSIDSAGTTSATYIIFGRNSAASNKFTVRSDGAGFLDAAAWTYGSDATIKENIEYLNPSNCLSLILNAKPAKFDYIDGQKSNYGYIAQDVQTWLPEAVSETPNGKLGLQDGFINAVGTGAIQALNDLIQEQQALIASQSELIQTLTSRIEALEQA